jgi:copper resistance protein D
MKLFEMCVQWPMRRVACLLPLAFLAVLFAGTAPRVIGQNPPAQDHSMDGMDMKDMPMEGMDHSQHGGPTPEELLAWKKESEFNHHLAGFLVVLAGIFILAEPVLRKRWSGVKYAWPMCFVLSGLFVLVWSDTELWPFGPQSWWYGLTHNTEDLQHKTFAVILLALGFLEIQRARGVIKAAWAGWIFPVLAIGGSALLLFHHHHTGMHGADHMKIMAHIQSEHLSYATVGLGIGLSKGLAETRTSWQKAFAVIWPVLMIVLGVLLMMYTE